MYIHTYIYTQNLFLPEFTEYLFVIEWLLFAIYFSGFTPPKVECELPLGVQTGAVPDSAMSGNSPSNSNLRPRYGRLNSQSPNPGWCSGTNRYSDYLQVDFGKAVKITRMATQGRYDANHWVTHFSLAYSQNANLFEIYEKGKVLNVVKRSVFAQFHILLYLAASFILTIREIPDPSTHFLAEQTLDNLQYELKDHDYLIH